MFPQYETVILSIKPSIREAPDKRIWLKQKSGVYTTKSGYYAMLEENMPTPVERSDGSLQWIPDVWDLRTSPKIKLFLWKAAQGALPVGDRLASRHMLSIPTCLRCGQVETIPHLLFHFEFAKQVWREASFAASFEPENHHTFPLVWKVLKSLQCLPPTGFALAPWVCWKLWKARNNLIFNSISGSATETLLRYITEAKDWLNAQPIKSQTQTRSRAKLLSKSRQSEMITCNTDASWREDIKTVGLGWVFSQPQSDTTSTFSGVIPFVQSPLMAEALAIRPALVKAKELSFRRITINSDSLQLIRAITTEIHGVLYDISSF